MSSAAGSYGGNSAGPRSQATLMMRFANHLQYRYVLEACERAPSDHGEMSPHDKAALCDPALLGGSQSDVEDAVRSYLDMDMSFFERVRQQLGFMARVWDAVIQEKYYFDAEDAIGSDDRRMMEACLLCLRVIPNRAVGTGPGLTSPSFLEDTHTRNAHATGLSANSEIGGVEIEPPHCRCDSPTASSGRQNDPTPSEERGADALLSGDEYGSDGSSVTVRGGPSVSANANTADVRVELAGIEAGRISQASSHLAQKRKYGEVSGDDLHDEGPPRKKVTWSTWR